MSTLASNPIGGLGSILSDADQGWKASAACSDPTIDPEIFHATGATSPEVRRAKAVCRGCPVQMQCLKWALDTEEPHGILGGATIRQRRAILRKRALGTSDQSLPAHHTKPLTA